jgi:hypothetical protein
MNVSPGQAKSILNQNIAQYRAAADSIAEKQAPRMLCPRGDFIMLLEFGWRLSQ